MATNYDEKLSEIIAEAMELKGSKGVIHMEPALSQETAITVSETDRICEKI